MEWKHRFSAGRWNRTGCVTVLGSVDYGDAIAGLDKLAISVPAPRNVSRQDLAVQLEWLPQTDSHVL